MHLFRVLGLSICAVIIARGESFTVTRSTGGPDYFDNSGKDTGFPAFLEPSGITDSGFAFGHYYGSNNLSLVSPFYEHNGKVFGYPSNPLVGPQAVPTAVSPNGEYSAGQYEPAASGRGDFMYVKRSAAAAQVLNVPIDFSVNFNQPSSRLSAVNNSGVVVGWVSSASSNSVPATRMGIIIAGGVYTTVSYPGSTYTSFGGINDAGEIVGSAIVGNVDVAFTYTNKTFNVINSSDNGSGGFFPLAVNDSGEIVGLGNQFNFFLRYPALYQNGTLFDLNTLDGNNPNSFAYATGINNSGTIIGANGGGAVLIATPISASAAPEPASLGLIALATLLFVGAKTWSGRVRACLGLNCD